jgi:hypothetical protein
MRKVEVLDEPQGQRRWTAVDAMTRQVILRLHDENLLRDVLVVSAGRSSGLNASVAQGSGAVPA